MPFHLRHPYSLSLKSIYLALVIVTSVGCIEKSANEVIVHSALDREFSEPILEDLARELDLTILPKFDQESNKTVGLVTGIIQSRKRPQADIFWNNEILHTLRLEKLGLLEVYRSPQADSYPATFVSPSNQWHGFAARARVLIVNTELLPDVEQRPDSIYDLADPKYAGKCAIARPLFGTTATHAAVLFSALGEEAAKKLLSDIATNAVVVGGNKQVAQKVARGECLFGVTDTDDALIELEAAAPVVLIFPDQSENQMGTLLIPNTLAIIKGGPNPARAKRLVDRLLQADIEERLANSASGQIPLHRSATTRSRAEPAGIRESNGFAFKVMEADFEAAAEAWDQAASFLNEQFPTGGR